MLSAALGARRPRAATFPRVLGLFLVGALGACNNSYPNPFANSNQMVPPPAASKIILSTDTWTTTPGLGSDLYSMDENGGGLTRLTFCNTSDRRCDYLEAIPGPSRERQAVLRLIDVNNDGKITSADGVSLRLLDLSRQVEGELVAANAKVSGADWSPGEEVLFYSAAGTNSTLEDLYQITSNAQSNTNLTTTGTTGERRPRFNTGGTNLAFEHLDGTTPGQIWIATSLGLRSVTTGGTAGAALAGTPYMVGSDADPTFSPDGRTVLFRRLTGTGNGGLGTWDLMTMRLDQTDAVPQVLVTGPAFRGDPDWNATGILFVETVSGAGPQVIFLDPTSNTRKVLMTAGAGFSIASPRWLP